MEPQNVALQHWALPQLANLLPLDEGELKQLLSYTNTLPDEEAARHLRDLLGDSPEALRFTTDYIERRADLRVGVAKQAAGNMNGSSATAPIDSHPRDVKHSHPPDSQPPSYAPPPGAPPAQRASNSHQTNNQPPSYAPPPGAPPGASRLAARNHTNQVVEAAKLRARDEVSLRSACRSDPADSPIARHAADAPECAVPIRYL